MRIQLLLFLASSIGLVAQVPSFKSFNPTQFSTNNFIISVKDGAPLTNVNGISTINLNGTNIVNLFAPASLTNQFHWTNDLNVLKPISGTSVQVTNLTAFQTLASAGAFILDATGATTLDLGTNCVSALQQGGLALSGQTTDPNDTTFNIDGGNFSGHLMFILNAADNSAFTFLNGSPFCDGTPGAFVRLNGDWITQTKGDGLLLYNFNGSLWTEVGRFSGSTNIVTGDNVWENVLAGNVQPVHGNENNVLHFTSGLDNNSTNIAMVVGTTNLWDASGSLLAAFHNAGTNQFVLGPTGEIAIGRGIDSFFGSISDGEALVSLRDATLGEPDGNQIDLITLTTDGQNRARLVASGNGTSLSLTYRGTIRTDFQPAVAATGLSVAYFLDTSNLLEPGDTFLSIRNAGTPIFQFAPAEASNPAGQIVWGPGATNVLRRSAANLQYTNGLTSQFGFDIIDGAGHLARFQNNGDGSPRITSSRANFPVYLNAGGVSAGLQVAAASIVPQVDDTMDIGNASSTAAWKDLYMKGVAYVQGVNDGAGNFTRLAIEHTGNAGEIQFSSLAGGTGVYRDFFFRSNTTTVAKISLDSGYAGGGSKFLSDDGTFKAIAGVTAEYLDADETENSTTPNALALSATVTAAGKYAFTLTVFLDNSTDADGACIDFDGGSATMTSFRAQTKVFDTALGLSSNSTALATDLCVATLTGAGSFEVSGGFTVNAGGTFIPRFFMNAATTGTLTAFRNSILTVTAAN